MSSFASQYVVEGTLLRACDLADTSIEMEVSARSE
jgi:hypothetical protein